MIEKRYSEGKQTCEVVFSMATPADSPRSAVCIVGDFNNWSPTANPLTQNEEGVWSISMRLDIGKEYLFRYLVDGFRWENDPEADRYVPSPYGDADNSAVAV